MKDLAADDPIRAWIDQMLKDAPAPTPEQTDLLRRVFRSTRRTTDARNTASEAA